jgi:hypothetical protein
MIGPGTNKNNESVMVTRTAMTYQSLDELIAAIERSEGGTQVQTQAQIQANAAQALAFVRDGIITGEGPTTAGRVHFSRELDAADAAWCRRILTAPALAQAPVSRAEVETLFQIDEAASERSDAGQFDDLFAKAVVHHTAAASGFKVPPRGVALAPDTAIERWAPPRAGEVDIKVLEWLSRQMRGNRRPNTTLMTLIATLVGAATLPIAQSLPGMFDLGM